MTKRLLPNNVACARTACATALKQWRPPSRLDLAKTLLARLRLTATPWRESSGTSVPPLNKRGLGGIGTGRGTSRRRAYGLAESAISIVIVAGMMVAALNAAGASRI